ncbi:MAG: ATP synthase F0 subunit B [Acidobacteriota bacterium]
MLEELMKSYWHIPIIMGMVLVYGILLNKVFFQPVQRVLEERKKRVRESGTLSDQSKDVLTKRFTEYEQAVLEAHRKATHLKEQARNEAYEYRSSVLGEVKAEVGKELQRAEGELTENVSAVKRDLEGQIPQFAKALASKLLGREVTA